MERTGKKGPCEGSVPSIIQCANDISLNSGDGPTIIPHPMFISAKTSLDVIEDKKNSMKRDE